MSGKKPEDYVPEDGPDQEWLKVYWPYMSEEARANAKMLAIAKEDAERIARAESK